MPNNSDDVEHARKESRKIRMRLAQRKHRARAEQKLQDLEGQVQLLSDRLESLDTNFDSLETHLLKAARGNTEVLYSIRAAIHLFRNTSGLKLSTKINQTLPVTPPLTCSPGLDGLDIEHDSSGQELSAFSLQLYSYCTKLGYRILSSDDAASLRIARKIFRYRLTTDAHKGETSNLAFLRDVLLWRSRQLGSDECLQVLKLPRWPGFSDFLDAREITGYLEKQGLVFSDDTVRLTYRSGVVSEEKVESWTPSAVQPCGSAALPFGLLNMTSVDTNNGGLMSPESQGTPQSNEWMDIDTTNFTTTFGDPIMSGNTYWQDDFSFFENSEPEVPQTAVQICTQDLIQSLALAAICMGGPGPGWLPSEIDAVLRRLADQASNFNT